MTDPTPKPSAVRQADRKWTLWSDQRPPNEPGIYRYRASFKLLGLPVTAEWSEKMTLCGMGFADSQYWPLSPCYWDGYRRYITIKNLEWSPHEDEPERAVWSGLDFLPCPFTGEEPRIETKGAYIGAPLWKTEYIRVGSSAVPYRTFYDAKKAVTAWNTRRASHAAEVERLRAGLIETRAMLNRACDWIDNEPSGMRGPAEDAAHTKIINAIDAQLVQIDQLTATGDRND